MNESNTVITPPLKESFVDHSELGLTSVIMRTKDRPLLLERAIASVLSQHCRNWELIIVNDGGSREAVESIIEKIKNKPKNRIQTLHIDDSKGMEHASNRGLEISNGEFFVIHDDDDSWDQNFLSKTSEFLAGGENQNFVAVSTNCEVIKEEIREGEIIFLSIEPWTLWSRQVSLLDVLVRNKLPTISTVIRRSVLKTIGLYNENMPVLGDWDFNLRLLMQGEIGTIEIPLAYYHQRVEDKSPSGNSIHSGASTHHDQWNKYRNDLVRNAVHGIPGIVGVLNPILTRMDEIESKLMIANKKLIDLEFSAKHSNDSVHTALHQIEIFLNKSLQQQNSHIESRFVTIFEKIERSTFLGLLTKFVKLLARRN